MLLEFLKIFAEAYESTFKVENFCKTFPHDDNYAHMYQLSILLAMISSVKTEQFYFVRTTLSQFIMVLS